MVCLGHIRVNTLYKGDKDRDDNNNINNNNLCPVPTVLKPTFQLILGCHGGISWPFNTYEIIFTFLIFYENIYTSLCLNILVNFFSDLIRASQYFPIIYLFIHINSSSLKIFIRQFLASKQSSNMCLTSTSPQSKGRLLLSVFLLIPFICHTPASTHAFLLSFPRIPFYIFSLITVISK